MARSRNLKPGFFKNEELTALGPEAMLLFAGLWTLADRAGRLEDRPKRIKAEIFPYWPQIDIDAVLSSLTTGGFIVRYEAEGKRYIAVPNFGKHQNPHIREAVSMIPAPCEHSARIVQASENPEQAAPLTVTCNPITYSRAKSASGSAGRSGEFAGAYPEKSDQHRTVQEYLSVVKPGEEDLVFACLNRYLASDEVARRMIQRPWKWLQSQSENGWRGEWKPADQRPDPDDDVFVPTGWTREQVLRMREGKK